MKLQEIARHTAAFLNAALAPAVAVTALDYFPSAPRPQLDFLTIAFAVALGHALFLGLPLFLAIHPKQRVRLLPCVAGGFAVGALPIGLMAWPLTLTNFSAWTDDLPTIIDGIPTEAGWIQYFATVLSFGLLGTFAGFFFWLTLRLTARTVSSLEESQPAVAARGRRISARTTRLAATAILISVAIFALPKITEDRTCHNMFRDGRTSITPEVNMELDIPPDEWPKLTKVLERFAREHELSFRDASFAQPDVVQVLGLSLCHDAGANIEVNEQRWESHDARSFSERAVDISIFEVNEGSDWQRLARELLAEIESTWPGKVQFIGERGRIIPIPQELQGGKVISPELEPVDSNQ